MGIIEKLFSQANKKNEKMYIAEGAIILWDARIMLKSISILEIFSPPKQSLIPGIAMGIFGMILIGKDLSIVQNMGRMLLLLGVVSALFAMLANLLMEYSLKIQMDSGRIINFWSRDIEFLRRFMKEIVESIDNDHACTYIDMRSNYIEQNAKEVRVENLYKQDANGGTIFNGNVIFDGKNLGNIFMGGSTIHGDVSASENTDKSQEASVLSEKQWSILEEFFVERLNEMEKTERYYISCNEMRKLTREKNSAGMRDYMRTMGKTALNTVLGSAASEMVKKLLVKILQTG